MWVAKVGGACGNVCMVCCVHERAVCTHVYDMCVCLGACGNCACGDCVHGVCLCVRVHEGISVQNLS